MPGSGSPEERARFVRVFGEALKEFGFVSVEGHGIDDGLIRRTYADFDGNANVVRVLSEEDDPGPRRIGLRFTDFATEADRDRLMRFLGSGAMRVAPSLYMRR